MLIPSRYQKLLNQYEAELFDITQPENKRLEAFYLLIRPVLNWAATSLQELGLEKDEADSELFIITEKLFSNYNIYKGPLVPYLSSRIPWFVSEHLKHFKKTLLWELPAGFTKQNGYIEPLDHEEYYLTATNILFNNRFVLKKMSYGQKFLLYTILTSEDNELTACSLARKLSLDRRTLKSKLLEIKEELENGGFYAY